MILLRRRSSPRDRLRAVLSGQLLLVGLCCGAQAAFAQQGDTARLVGLVTDRLTNRPAIGAQVVIVSLDRHALTDSEGWFVFERLAPGEYVLEISYLNLTSDRYSVDLQEGTTRLDFEIVTPPFELEELVVEVRVYRTLKMLEFQRRRERLRGYFIDREEIESSAPLFVSDLLRHVPGLQVEWTIEGNVRLVMGHGMQACEPDLYIDGSPSHAARINDYLPNLLEAVEIYSRAFDRPQRFYSTRCGAILLWTREGA